MSWILLKKKEEKILYGWNEYYYYITIDRIFQKITTYSQSKERIILFAFRSEILSYCLILWVIFPNLKDILWNKENVNFVLDIPNTHRIDPLVLSSSMAEEEGQSKNGKYKQYNYKQHICHIRAMFLFLRLGCLCVCCSCGVMFRPAAHRTAWFFCNSFIVSCVFCEMMNSFTAYYKISERIFPHSHAFYLGRPGSFTFHSTILKHYIVCSNIVTHRSLIVRGGGQ